VRFAHATFAISCVLAAGCGAGAAAGGGAGTTPPEGARHQASAHDIGPATERDRVPHPHWSTADYVAHLEDPHRDEWQRPAQLVEALRVRPGMRVADVGTGSGYFLPHLSRAVGANGHVVGEDIDDGLLGYARRRIEHEQLGNTEARLGQPADVGLEAGRYDLVLVVDTYHHVVDRPAWLASIGRALVPGRGRFVLVEFRDGPLPVGPPPEHKVLRVRVERELRAAGFVLTHEHDFLPYQYAIELMRPAAAGAPDSGESSRSTEAPLIVLDDDLTPTDGGFPALSADHTRVALAIVDPDGARAAPNLLVRIVPFAGGTPQDFPILSVAEGARLDARDPTPAENREVRGRLARAAAQLLAGEFHALVPFSLSLSQGAVAPLDVTTAGLRLTFDPATRALAVTDTRSGAERFATTLEPGAPRRPRATCVHPPYVVGAWVEPSTSLFVLRVAYAGTDTCPEPAWVDRVEHLH